MFQISAKSFRKARLRLFGSDAGEVDTLTSADLRHREDQPSSVALVRLVV
jgi:hypothetical protein